MGVLGSFQASEINSSRSSHLSKTIRQLRGNDAKTPNYFKGRTLVITSAGSGIGRSTAAIFGREGANVVCADIDEQSAMAATRQTEDAGGVGASMWM